ncbi:MAG: tryptophan--tRNA ligase [Spirochaeta sp. LUC14_002_19_P3]|nr:MAG: tryptophan--tRNA ligase [Spirochaeta sp. LUC14_002_19_P3]
MKKQIVLTGIKPTGMPHLGNCLGAIRPALHLAEQQNCESRFFIADYHSLNTIRDADTLRAYIYEVAASWLAAGLNPDKTLIYRQSDVPETFELATILTAFTAKGLMNRAHAYKAAAALNVEGGQPEDHQINMGLYTYPILMAADILLFDTNLVPVGKDQVQHVEMAQDIAGVINYNYKKDVLVIPEALTTGEMMAIPGLDGRKMSKSYDNHIPLFLPEKQLRKRIMKIVTNSQGVEEAKNPDACTIFALYKLIANESEQHALAERYRAGGMGWGEAKQELFERLNAFLSPMREKYDALMADRSRIDTILADGARRARETAQRTLSRVRKAVGIG